jgi:hypothetical protein
MQVSYNCLKNPSKNLWCNRQAKRDRQKLVNFVVPDKSEKFPGSQRNWDMEISIRKVQFGSQHTWKNTSSDRSVGLHFEMGNRKVTVQGEVHHRCVGFVSSSRGIGSCVSGTPSFVGQSDSYVSDLRQGEVPSSV